MTINKPYSFNNLISAIASVDLHSDIVTIPSFTFTDAHVAVIGKIMPTFDLNHSVDEKPWNDLKDVFIEISSVVVSGEQKEIIYNWEEKEKLVKSVKDLLI